MGWGREGIEHSVRVECRWRSEPHLHILRVLCTVTGSDSKSPIGSKVATVLYLKHRAAWCMRLYSLLHCT